METPTDDRGPGGVAALLVLVGLALVILWAMVPETDQRGGASPVAALAVLLVFVAAFAMLAMSLVHRLAAVATGAIASLVLGALVGFYSPRDAAAYLWGKADVLLLLGGIGVVTGLLRESGTFERVAARALGSARGNGRLVMVMLCLTTYVLSCFVNNLSTIMVVIPLSLLIAEALDMDRESLVLGEVIASNLGGASTLVGDFPNMLIATETGIPFHEFLTHLAPVCLVQLLILLAYLAPRFSVGSDHGGPTRELVQKLRSRPFDRDVALRGQLILTAMVVSFLVCGELGISPALTAGGGALLALLLGGTPWRSLVTRAVAEDVLFFVCLFLMVGAVDAAGVLEGFGGIVAGLWRESSFVGLITIAWSAALLTCALNAGPTTALLMHVILASAPSGTVSEPVWWALSLGVCAGSSATLTGATAGPVAASLLAGRGVELTFARFARTGVPLMLAFLLVSTIYLALIAP